MEINTLENALACIERYSVRNIAFKDMPPINWDLWRANVSFYRQSHPHKDDLDIVRCALENLHDGHSFLAGNLNAPHLQQTAEPMPVGAMIGKAAYIRMPPCGLGNNDYAEATQNIIKELDHARPDGWIVDLRINGGGDFGPMMAGIGPLLGHGVHGRFASPHLNMEDACEYKDGKALCGIDPETGEKIVRGSVQNPYTLQREKPPITVLTGDDTSSSGEFILISFMKRRNVKIIGEPSWGNSSVNSPLPPFKDRTIVLTMGLMLDRDKVPYGGKIHPDTLFTGGARPEEIRSEGYDPATDPLVILASRWIQHVAVPHPAASASPSGP